ncbi:hypothetical protein BKA62DRAFT_676952 [Auriculariales sp. MPI-PUGE-AT-0066]|nr:hypothetical protein BKA62DRAFT_676952 [Auriculariales sp. MPI-PUGE-AT-0066]
MLRSDDGDELGDELDDELQPLSPDPVQLRFHHGLCTARKHNGLRLHVADALPQVGKDTPMDIDGVEPLAPSFQSYNAAALDVRLRQGQQHRDRRDKQADLVHGSQHHGAD